MSRALVIDTCGLTGYVAVVDMEHVDAAAVSERRLGERATQEELLPAVEAVLREAELALPGLEAVAVVHGPGSFTGVRIGLATAKGLCEAANLPLVTLSRLAVLSGAAPDESGWAWLTAGRGDVYAARFVSRIHVAGSEDTGTGQVLSLEAAIAAARQQPVAVCEASLRQARADIVWVTEAAFESLLRSAAVAAVRRGEWADAALSDALYLRVPDAELALRARQG